MEDSEEHLERLRAVFDLFDTDKVGYISVDHFVQVASQFGAETTESQVSWHEELIKLEQGFSVF